MAAITPTVKNVRPLQGAILRKKQAAAAMAPGDTVTLLADGTVQKTANGSASFYGIVYASDQQQTAIAAGEQVGVVVFGPVTGYASLQPGLLVWLSGTAGKLDGASGTVCAGYVEDAVTVFVMPNVTNVGSS